MKSIEEIENKGDGDETDKEADCVRVHSNTLRRRSSVFNNDGLDLVADIVKTVDHLF